MTKPSGNRRSRRGTISLEYLLLGTIIGIGGIVGFASLREALIRELNDLANAVDVVAPVTASSTVGNADASDEAD